MIMWALRRYYTFQRTSNLKCRSISTSSTHHNNNNPKPSSANPTPKSPKFRVPHVSQPTLPYEEFNDEDHFADVPLEDDYDVPESYEADPFEDPSSTPIPSNTPPPIPSLHDVLSQDLSDLSQRVEEKDQDENKPDKETFLPAHFQKHETQHLARLHALIHQPGFLSIPESQHLILHKAFIFLHHISTFLGRPFPTNQQGQEYYTALLLHPSHPLSDLSFGRSAIIQLARGACVMFEYLLERYVDSERGESENENPFIVNPNDIIPSIDSHLLERWQTEEQSSLQLRPSQEGGEELELTLSPTQKIQRKRLLEHSIRSTQRNLDSLLAGIRIFLDGGHRKVVLERLVDDMRYLTIAHRIKFPHLYPPSKKSKSKSKSKSTKAQVDVDVGDTTTTQYTPKLNTYISTWNTSAEPILQLSLELARGLDECGWGVDSFDEQEVPVQEAYYYKTEGKKGKDGISIMIPMDRTY